MTASTVSLDGGPLTAQQVELVARGRAKVTVSAKARSLMQRARTIVDRAAAGMDGAVYGINTGFGSLSRVRIEGNDLEDMQRNLVRSHAAGVGDPLPEDVVRAMMLLTAASLARGKSGVRPVVVERIAALLNAGITPVVPSRGSVGASGDLAPLSHAALVLLGEGSVTVDGHRTQSATALKKAHIQPIKLAAKEGLALINGTHLMAGMAALILQDVNRLLDSALGAYAMAIDACRATDAFLDTRLHEARNQQGQQIVAERVRSLLKGSTIVTSHIENDQRVQDPYSLRAGPQVLGAALDALSWAQAMVDRELGAVTDNPLVFAPPPAAAASTRKAASDSAARSIVSGGNFHGMPMALALDVLKIALCHVAGIAERRIYWVLAATEPEIKVRTYLSPKPGLHSGMMIVQYTAAALCNELQTLATPASVANIPTSAGMEDYNSMGATSAHMAWRAVDLVRKVIACELLVMAEAIEYHRPLKSGAAVEALHAQVRKVVPKLIEDRPMGVDIEKIAAMLTAT